MESQGLTTLQAVSVLSGVVVAVTSLMTWIFSKVVDMKITSLKLQLKDDYAGKEESMPRREYEVRHAEIQRELGRFQGTLEELERRFNILRLGLDRRNDFVPPEVLPR